MGPRAAAKPDGVLLVAVSRPHRKRTEVMVEKTRQQKLISARCDELRRLQDGWDGPDSRAPTESALNRAETLATRVDVWPTEDGGVWLLLDRARVVLINRDGTVN